MRGETDEHGLPHGIWERGNGAFGILKKTYVHGVMHGYSSDLMWDNIRPLRILGWEEGHMRHGKKHGPWTEHPKHR